MYTGVYMAARIYDRAKGKTTNLWFPDSGIVLTSMNIKMVQGGNSEISIEAEVPYTKGVALLEDTLFDRSNVLMVQFGYPQDGFMSPWFAGLTKEVSCQIADTISFSIEATGAGALAMARSSTKTWTGTTWSILETIAKKFNWKIEFQPPEQAAQIQQNLSWIETSYVQGGETYFMFLSQLLYPQGVTFWIGINSYGKAAIFLRHRNSEVNEQPTYAFVKYGQLQPAKNQYPLLSFNCSDGIFLTSGDSGIRHVWVDEDGQIIEYEATEDKSTKTKLGEAGAGQGNTTEVHEESGTTIDRENDPNDEETGQTQAVPPSGAESSDTVVQQQLDNVLEVTKNATIETIGLPTILPGELIRVYGCSRRYDGNYRVQTVTHSLGTEFKTSLECIRDAYPAGYAKGEVMQSNNTQEGS